MSLVQLFVQGKSKGHNPVMQTTEEDPSVISQVDSSCRSAHLNYEVPPSRRQSIMADSALIPENYYNNLSKSDVCRTEQICRPSELLYRSEGTGNNWIIFVFSSHLKDILN
jgi:hypothetical protein